MNTSPSGSVTVAGYQRPNSIDAVWVQVLVAGLKMRAFLMPSSSVEPGVNGSGCGSSDVQSTQLSL